MDLTSIAHFSKSISTTAFLNQLKEHLQLKGYILGARPKKPQSSRMKDTHSSSKTRLIFSGAVAQQLQG